MTRITPIPFLILASGLAGAAKLRGTRSVRARYAHWGDSPWRRRALGLGQLGIALAGARGYDDAGLRRLAGAGALGCAGGALIGRARRGEGPRALIAPVALGALGWATYHDLTLDIEA